MTTLNVARDCQLRLSGMPLPPSLSPPSLLLLTVTPHSHPSWSLLTHSCILHEAWWFSCILHEAWWFKNTSTLLKQGGCPVMIKGTEGHLTCPQLSWIQATEGWGARWLSCLWLCVCFACGCVCHASLCMSCIVVYIMHHLYVGLQASPRT